MDGIWTRVKALAEKHPECGLTFGYIGNFYESEGRDDRSWYVFSKVWYYDQNAIGDMKRTHSYYVGEGPNVTEESVGARLDSAHFTVWLERIVRDANEKYPPYYRGRQRSLTWING